VFAKNIDKAFAHVAIDAALDRVINRRNAFFNLKKNIEEPFGIGVKVFPMGDKHIIANGLVAMVHCLFEGWYVLWRLFFYNLSERFPVLGNVIIGVLLRIADTPMTSDRKDDVVFLQEFL